MTKGKFISKFFGVLSVIATISCVVSLLVGIASMCNEYDDFGYYPWLICGYSFASALIFLLFSGIGTIVQCAEKYLNKNQEIKPEIKLETKPEIKENEKNL